MGCQLTSFSIFKFKYLKQATSEVGFFDLDFSLRERREADGKIRKK